MNRIASMLTATVTTALSGALLAGFGASQGVFGSPKDTPKNEIDQNVATAESASPGLPPTTQASTQTAIVQTVYVDKTPVIVTREVVVQAQRSAPTEAATAPPSPAPRTPEAAAAATADRLSGGSTDGLSGAALPAPGTLVRESASPTAAATMAPPRVETAASIAPDATSRSEDDDDHYDDHGGERQDDDDHRSGAGARHGEDD